MTSLATKLRDRLKEQGVREVHVEGAGQGDWIVVDIGDIIVHLFRGEVREFYGIEDMWAVPHAGGNGRCVAARTVRAFLSRHCERWDTQSGWLIGAAARPPMLRRI